MTSQIICAFSVQAVYIATSSLFTGVCFILMTFNTDIRMHFRRLNRTIIARKRINPRRKMEMMKKLLEIIEFHARVRG